jgi:hypothetical protein
MPRRASRWPRAACAADGPRTFAAARKEQNVLIARNRARVDHQGGSMTTRTIAIVAFVIAVIVLILLLL